jgi:hypothetical protein
MPQSSRNRGKGRMYLRRMQELGSLQLHEGTLPKARSSGFMRRAPNEGIHFPLFPPASDRLVSSATIFCCLQIYASDRFISPAMVWYRQLFLNTVSVIFKSSAMLNDRQRWINIASDLNLIKFLFRPKIRRKPRRKARRKPKRLRNRKPQKKIRKLYVYITKHRLKIIYKIFYWSPPLPPYFY